MVVELLSNGDGRNSGGGPANGFQGPAENSFVGTSVNVIGFIPTRYRISVEVNLLMA